MQRIPAKQGRSSGWEFDPAVAGCGLQGTANSPSSTTVIEPSLYCGMIRNADSWRPRPPEWSRAESNRRPPDCDSGALPTELLPQICRGTRAGRGRRAGRDHARPCGPPPPRSGSGFPAINGEGGIRTHGPHGEHTLSRRADSTALAPLPGLWIQQLPRTARMVCLKHADERTNKRCCLAQCETIAPRNRRLFSTAPGKSLLSSFAIYIVPAGWPDLI